MASLAGIDLFSIISDIKVFLYSGFQTLPLTMAGTLLLIGLFTANFSALFFLIGFLVITPLTTLGINSITPDSWKLEVSDSCNAIIPFPTTGGKSKHMISYWLAMGTFMFGYLISNAAALYEMPTQYPTNVSSSVKAALDQKTMYRKSQMAISLIMLSIIMVIFVSIRVLSGCDNLFGIVPVIVVVAFGAFGWLWFTALSSKANARLSDLFGIANRLMSPDSMPDPNTICLPLTT